MLITKSLFIMLLLGSMLLVAPTGCQTSSVLDPVAPAAGRVLISSSLITESTPSQLRGRYTGVSAVFQFFVRFGIRAYRLEYTTTNSDGTKINASGVVIVPTDAGKAVPLLSMQHGTIQNDADAPSYFGRGSEAYMLGSLFASHGYIISAPDYVGYGASKDVPHPYEHRSSLATASLDMLRATREFVRENQIGWDDRLFLAGYSEGGYATMALQKKIEEETGDEFNLVASSCGAGAYDKPSFMQHIVNEPTSGVASINRLYVWVLLTYDRIYGLNRPMNYYFREPYASQVTASGKDVTINVSLHTTFTDSFKKAINEGTDAGFLKAVQDNDIHDWKPETRTRLYHGDADDTVLYLNSQNTYDAMQKRGATNVTLEKLRGANHASGILGFVTGTYSFFGGTQ
ncbi:alpha/beta hydrolase family protein [Spirosoma utsteinense]|uniref:Pimeloyl-ACP methyl ester carboxylesterase n=1 Tax=Spirosoma utsteinense TaxID=2585773 RepID=A0ABR6W4D4_9BACT|nr:lipase family protein [Spirosoma utsteinense]MBC3786403.1 pimeloyl-ACP methyl ester carboxylesterase [Spirosoma utsteinense]MBC3791452.1 pimeloyl-ACP methyl ester carboxylesterase [Spirosoma utsteinense]